MATTRYKLSEVARERGEVVRRGDKGAKGYAQPLPPNIPVGIAPPEPMQVHSVFDSRPIGAYDFALDAFNRIGNNESRYTEWNVSVPDGYVAILRRVRLEFTTPGLVNSQVDPSDSNRLEWRLLRDRAPVPSWLYVMRHAIENVDLPGFQVYGFWQQIGLAAQRAGFLATSATIGVGVTFIGTLVPSKSRDPNVEVASDPVNVRLYDEQREQAIGAAAVAALADK